jgi:DNA-binding transcriptional LysR family regulator
MELRHLRSFVVLADERHFGRSATRLHIAQPALSQQIKQLEHELGCLLFDRSTRRVELTEAGRLLLDRAQVILGEADRAQDDLSQLAAGRLGRVAVGFIGTATYDVLPRVAQRVRAQLPALTLDLRGELLSPELVDGLHERRFDLAVMRTGPGGTDDLVVETLREERLVAVLPAGHRLAGSGTVALGDLADEPFVTYPAGPRSSMSRRVLDACQRAGFQPRDVVEVAETATLVVFVAAGLGVALVPAPVQALRLDGVAYVPLRGTPESVDLVLARRPDASPATLRVAEAIRAQAAG